MTSSSSTSDYVLKETATVNWTINDFRNLHCEVGSKLFSAPNSKNEFRLYLYSKIVYCDSEVVFVSLCYNRVQSQLPMKYRVSIMNENGEKQYTQENYWKYFELVNGRLKYRDFIYLIGNAECLLHLVNGNLIINCEVDVLERSVNYNKTNATKDSGQTDLQNDYQALLENPEFSDVVLLVKGKEFKVHKNIFAARSKVFRAMFSNDLKEKKQNRVEITDVEVDVFEHLLRYIYTGKIPEMDEHALELFVAADKYQLAHLKLICEQSLDSNLTTESVVNVLLIADMHNASGLKSKCIEYIRSNSKEVKRTDTWKQMKSKPVLQMELFDKLSAKK